MSNSHDVFAQMKTLVESMEEHEEKWAKGNKSAAAKMRKNSSTLDKLCKEFRRLSVAECKK